MARNVNRVRRWVVERTNSWHNRFRKLFVRYEKKVRTTLAWYNWHAVYCLQEDIIGIGS